MSGILTGFCFTPDVIAHKILCFFLSQIMLKKWKKSTYEKKIRLTPKPLNYNPK